MITKEDVGKFRMAICDELGKEKKDAGNMVDLLESSNEYLKIMENMLASLQ
jgi:hypothetical protein